MWGPISMQSAQQVGASFASSSIVLRVCIPEQIRAAALKEIPEDVLPTPGDTAATLRRRLGASKFLEDSHVLEHGRGPRRVRLNDTAYPQPRRRSWSLRDLSLIHI